MTKASYRQAQISVPVELHRRLKMESARLGVPVWRLIARRFGMDDKAMAQRVHEPERVLAAIEALAPATRVP